MLPNGSTVVLHARQNVITDVPDSLQPSRTIHTTLKAWQIVLIVIGGLILISFLVLIGLRIRTHYAIKRVISSARVEQSFTGDAFLSQSTGEKRDSVVGSAKVKIRRLIRKTKPSGLSRAMEMSPEANGNGVGSGGGVYGGRRKGERIRSQDSNESRGLGKGPFKIHAHAQSQSHSFVGTGGSGLTSLGREEDVERGLRGYTISLDPGRGREDDWDDTHSVAHTIRDSFDQPPSGTAMVSASTSAPASTIPLSPSSGTGCGYYSSSFSPPSSYTSPESHLSPSKSPGEEGLLSGSSRAFGGWGHERPWTRRI